MVNDGHTDTIHYCHSQMHHILFTNVNVENGKVKL